MSHTPDPFGYFRAEPFGWTDCASTAEGAQPLYDQATIDALSAELAAARSEVNDQARLNGMGAERELALIAERDSLRAEVERLRKGLENTQAEAVLGMAVAARLSAPPVAEGA